MSIDTETPEAVYIEDRGGATPGTVDQQYELSGAHDGEPIRVWVLNPHQEYDDGGICTVFDGMATLDGEPLDRELYDTYSDLIREMVAEGFE